MSTDSNPPDGLRGAIGELVGELGSLVPRLVERSRDQLAVVAKVIEHLPCLGALAGAGAPKTDDHTPDLRLVHNDAAEGSLETTEPVAEPVEVQTAATPRPVAVAKKAPARKAPAKKAAATKKAPAKKAPAKKAPANASARKSVARKSPANKAPAAPSPAAVPAAPPAGAPGLAIPDYDELAASQVIPRLDNVSPEELEAIRLHETSNRHRRTILSRVAQLQTS